MLLNHDTVNKKTQLNKNGNSCPVELPLFKYIYIESL